MKMRKKINLSNRIVLINKKFKKKEFYHYFKTPNLSLVIPIYKKKFIIVSQKRIPINKINYEFPSGLIEKKETLLQSAKKELLEETGYKCIGKLHKLIYLIRFKLRKFTRNFSQVNLRIRIKKLIGL